MARSLLRITSLVSFNTLISRTSGFIRDMVFAQLFGAVAGFDAFLVAFKIPNFMRRLFAEGAFSQAFVPILSEYRKTHSHEEVRDLIDHAMGTLGGILFILTITVIFAAPLFIAIFAPGFGYHSARFALATSMLRITFPYLMFISLTALCGAILNSYDSFGIPAFTSVLLNICLIFSAIFFTPFFKIPFSSLAWGTFVAGIVQLCFQLPFLYRKQLLPRPKWGFANPGVRRILKLMVPALFGVSVAQVNLLLDTIFASFLVVGSVSWLYYSERLMMFPLGIFGVAIATVILPHLSRQHTEKNSQTYSQTLDWAIRLLLLIGLPAALGLLVLAGPLLSTLLQYRQFNSFDVLMSRESLMAFSIGLPGFMLVKILASGFYARQNIRTPVKIAVIAMITNMLINAALIYPLKHAGLALATSLSSALNAALLLRGLLKYKIYQPQKGWLKFSLQITFANILMCIFLVWGSGNIQTWFMHGWKWRSAHLFSLTFGGIILYFGCLLIAGWRPKEIRLLHG